MKRFYGFILLAALSIAAFPAQGRGQIIGKTFSTSSSIANPPVTTFDTTGIVGVAVGPDTLITVTVPANAWADGQPLIVKCIYDGLYGNTMVGSEYLRTQVAVGNEVYRIDSTTGYGGGTHGIVPYSLEFTRVGNQVWFTPSLIHVAASPNDFDLGNQNPVKGIAYAAYNMFAKVNGYANGHQFTSVDFTQPVVIRWITKWTTSHGDANTQVRMRSAGCHFEALN